MPPADLLVQLEQIYEHFADPVADSPWSIYRDATAIIDALLDRIELLLPLNGCHTSGRASLDNSIMVRQHCARRGWHADRLQARGRQPQRWIFPSGAPYGTKRWRIITPQSFDHYSSKSGGKYRHSRG